MFALEAPHFSTVPLRTIAEDTTPDNVERHQAVRRGAIAASAPGKRQVMTNPDAMFQHLAHPTIWSSECTNISSLMNNPIPTGLEAVFLANRDPLLRFLRAHGAGEAAEDLLQELWLKLAAAPSGPVASPMSYLYRAANNLMIDRHRAERQAAQRNRDWSDLAHGEAGGASDEPLADRRLISREELGAVEAALAGVGDRATTVFRRHRIDGLSQRAVAAEMGLGLSTVEGDLRAVYGTLIEARRRIDEV
jgi:RNA polymerase sigma-70 factor (ECF subfamily)